MFSEWNSRIGLKIIGESHAPEIGADLTGIPAGESIDLTQVRAQMRRRAPGNDKTATPRKEADEPIILGGITDGKTDGSPIIMRIKNTNTRSGDYKEVEKLPRPSHADYPAYVKFGAEHDFRGGGHFSGRLTAPMVFAGAVARQILARKGIQIGAHIQAIGTALDAPIDPVNPDPALLERLSASAFALVDPEREDAMRTEVEKARLNGDSIGGIIECAVTGVSAGTGNTMFESIESKLSALLFGVPAVKGVEFGSGFALASMLGSEANDAYIIEDGAIKTKTNHNGGVLGGLANGMPIVFRVVIKPTPSIGQPQDTVNLDTLKPEKLAVKGRHDPCILPRAVPVIESVAAIGLLDMLLERGTWS